MKNLPAIQRAPPAPSILIGLLAICALAYLPGLTGGFLFDDIHNLVDNPSLRAIGSASQNWFALALSSGAGALRRPLSMLSFGVDYRFFGLNPIAFKITNLLIHLANGALIYALARRLAPRLLSVREGHPCKVSPSHIALFASALWLLHPLNVSTVVYVVQRMNLLATLFMLIGLLCYAEGRERMLRGEDGLASALASVCVFGVLAVFSKENGALIFGYALGIEACAYRFATPAPSERQILKAFFWLTVALPLVLFSAYLITHPHWFADSYAGRDFTLYQRLISEARILCGYLVWIIVPLPQWMGIFHDDFVKSTGVFSPLQTAASILFLIALIACAWKLRQRSPGLAFGVAWFLIGQSMESTILPLELIFEHRNYLPMAGLLLGIVCALATELPVKTRGKTLGIVAGAVLTVFAALTMTRAFEWGSSLRLATGEAARHPASARAQYEAGRAILLDGIAGNHRDEAEQRAVPYFEHAKRLDPTDLYGASALVMIHGRGGKPIAQDDIVDLAHRAKTILQPRINPLLVVFTGAIEGTISLAPVQMSLLVDSILDNRVFPATMRAMVLSDYGHYQFQVVHDNQNAISLTLAAAAEDPLNPLFQINLTKLALALGQSPMAREHLAIARRLNKVGIYDKVIGELGQQVAP